MAPILALIGIIAAVFVVAKFIWDLAQARGKAQGYIEASEYFREQERYLTEMADNYCAYLSNEYDRLSKDLSNKVTVH
jgi:hypothetical protein